MQTVVLCSFAVRSTSTFQLSNCHSYAVSVNSTSTHLLNSVQGRAYMQTPDSTTRLGLSSIED